MALARALAIEPRVLLLDEPFGALDAKVRKELRRWLREIHDQTGHTTVFVTHDQEEALELADRVVVMSQGTHRAGRHARRDLRPPGLALRLRLHRRVQRAAGRASRRAGSCSTTGRSSSRAGRRADGPRTLVFRPHDIDLLDGAAAASPARSSPSAATAPTRRLELEIGMRRHRIEIDVPADDPSSKKGDRVSILPTRWWLFDRRTARRRR